MMLGHRPVQPTPPETVRRSSGAGLCRAVACGLAIAAITVPAATRVALGAESYAEGLTPLSSDELRALRGGVIVNGISFDFGAIIQLRLSGELAAQTILTMNQDGSMSRLTEIFNSAVTEFLDPSQLAGTNIQLNGPQGSIGFIINDASGVSIALNNVNGGQMFGLLANGAIGRDITQSINATLTINNFSQINAGLMSDLAAGRAMNAGVPDLMLP